MTSPSLSKRDNLQFIEMFKAQPSLWKSQLDGKLITKEMRDEAYNHLVNFAVISDPTANRDTVIRKINNFKCNFEKEYKKKVAAEANGENYEPTLYYFEKLMFLKEQDLLERNKPITTYNVKEKHSNTFEISGENTEAKTATSACNCASVATTSTNFVALVTPQQPPPKRKILNCAQTEDPSNVYDSPKRKSKNVKQTPFAQYISVSLRALPEEQQNIAEKLFTDVLFHGRSGNLSRNTRLCSKHD